MAEVKKNNKKLKIFLAIGLLLLLSGLMIFLFSGDNFIILKDLFRDDLTQEEIRETLGELGFKGYFTFGFLSMLQVILTVLPAEPIQVMSGIAFGFWKGTLISLSGVFLGNTVIFFLYKIYGDRLENFFKTNADFDFETARRSNKVAIIVFILYFLPAIPYGLICLFSASIGSKYPKYILLTTLGAIPSICLGVGLGHIAIAASWILSVGVFLILIALLVVLYKKKAEVFARVNAFIKKKSEPYSSKTVVKKPKRGLLGLIAGGIKVYFSPKIKMRLKNKVGKIKEPAIVICNHGSFIDFLYAGYWLRRSRPNFITARLYFYHKRLGNFLRMGGVFPKSMFAADFENAKNCIRVLKDRKGVIAMMPEARLSTVGKFEGVQESTYRFLHKAGVSVYVLKLYGDYFAMPKWGDKARKGSLVEGEFKQLFTAEELKNCSYEHLKEVVDESLAYDEFAWLESKPKIHYKSKTLAVGLENILFRCPKCGELYSMQTSGREISCSKCGMKAVLNDRYAFEGETPFKNFAEWYAWQTDEMRKQILSDPNFALESEVTLHHSSLDGKKMLRQAGTGTCRLDRNGLLYRGERDGEQIEKFFPQREIYRLLFGAGEDFEIYEGIQIWYFRPFELRSCVAWYVASGLFKEVCE